MKLEITQLRCKHINDKCEDIVTYKVSIKLTRYDYGLLSFLSHTLSIDVSLFLYVA